MRARSNSDSTYQKAMEQIFCTKYKAPVWLNGIRVRVVYDQSGTCRLILCKSKITWVPWGEVTALMAVIAVISLVAVLGISRRDSHEWDPARAFVTPGRSPKYAETQHSHRLRKTFSKLKGEI